MANTKKTDTKTNMSKDAFLGALHGLRTASEALRGVGTGTEELEKKASSAQAQIVAALTVPGILTMSFAYDVLDRKGDVVEHIADATLADYATAPFLLDGKEYRAKMTAYRAAVERQIFANETNDDTVWAAFRRVFPTALAVLKHDMTAHIDEDGALVLGGGAGDDAKKLRLAAKKSVAALVTAAKGSPAKRDVSETKAPTPQLATLTDILRAMRTFLTQSLDQNCANATMAAGPNDDAIIADIAKLLPQYIENYPAE